MLEKFRDAWAKFEDSPFSIDVRIPSTVSWGCPDSEEPYDPLTHELMTRVNVPFGPALTGGTIFGGYVVVQRDPKTKAARRRFKELAGRAGASLPAVITDAFRDVRQWDVDWGANNASSWWIMLLLCNDGQFAYVPGDNGHPDPMQYRSELTIPNPWQSSARAIQDCKLASDQPTLPAIVTAAIRDDARALDERLNELSQEILPIDDEPDDWISNKSTAGLLGVVPKTLSNRRSAGAKLEGETESCGVHNEYCFWRKVGKSHPRYYLPLLKKSARQLGDSFPKNRLSAE
ncbi:MAG: hypothetical protein ACE5KM_13940 [Planctomycetaceae bacterium]